MSGEHEAESGLDDNAFKRLLIAVDDSATSRWALDVGGALAAKLDARVGLLHVVDLSKGFSPDLAVLDDRVMDQLRRAGAELLEKDERSLPAGLTVVRLLRDGDPPEEIVAAADEWRADVVILGAHARGVVARFLLGSTAETVVRRAHCPVLTIGHQPSPCAQRSPTGAGDATARPACGSSPSPAFQVDSRSHP